MKNPLSVHAMTHSAGPGLGPESKLIALLFITVPLLFQSTPGLSGASRGLVLMSVMAGAGLWLRHDWARSLAMAMLASALVALAVAGMGPVGQAAARIGLVEVDLASCLAIVLGGLLLRLMSRDVHREFALAALDQARLLADLSLSLDDTSPSK